MSDTFEDIVKQNWISVLYSLACLVKDVKQYTHDQFVQLHATLKGSNAHISQLCTSATPCSTKKDLRDWCATCAGWRTSILSSHKNRAAIGRHSSDWSKINSSKWPTDSQEVEKCFHPDWCNKQTAITNQDDISVMIGKMINCNDIRRSLSMVDPEDIRVIRNNVSHNTEVTTPEKERYCDKMMNFLQNPGIVNYNETKESYDKIKIFKEKTYMEIIKEKIIGDQDMSSYSSIIAQLETCITKDIAVCGGVQFVTRKKWEAREPKIPLKPMPTPVSVVFVHHTVTAHCHNLLEGIANAKFTQNFHMDGQSWDDIGYSFLIGEDGRVYEGRGWDKVGAHTLGWNTVSVAFAFMGNFSEKEADFPAIQALRKILDYGVSEGHLTADYKLYGHKDVRPTAGPGDKLYAQIQAFDRFDHNKPTKPQT